VSRDWQLFWSDILEAAEEIQQFTHGMDAETFCSDKRTYRAVLQCLLVIGEAAKKLPEEARQLVPEIEWRKIAGTRDVIAHGYFEVVPETIWSIVTTKIPPLVTAMKRVELP
jgi:uncharacterized protein with HEPN domain